MKATAKPNRWASVSWLALSLSAAGLSSGCKTQAACFDDCQAPDALTQGGGDSTGSGGDGLIIGLGGDDGVGMGGGQGRGGGGLLEDAGTNCDGLDLQSDLNNCGECGKHCVITGAEAKCSAGSCEIERCLPFRYDHDADPSNGCEYACEPATDPTELCNYVDDDCDGEKDEGFELATDPDHCGVCGNRCQLLHSVSAGCQAASCVVEECEPGWWDLDGVNANGCEYACVFTDAAGEPCQAGTAGCGVEVCDALDNDCNGKINDGNEDTGGPGGGTPCQDYCPGQDCRGECTPGVYTCVGTDLVCVPGAGPALETCDGKNNDCDDEIDEDFDFSTDPNHCGSCDVSCVAALPNAVAQCSDPAGSAPPACAILACKPGYKDLNPALAGCEQCPKFPTSPETCNGIDDDCDGVIDNASAIAAQKPAVTTFCNNGRTLGTTPCAGTTVSCGSDGWVCNYPTTTGVEVNPTTGKVRVVEQLCDAVDGNCDGQKDEAFLNKGAACSVGVGICGRSSSYACTADKTGTECAIAAVPGDAKDELCNGLDDNCDGQVDERTPVAGSTCFNGGSHACLGYTEPTVKVGSTWVYKYEASRPDATSIDPGINNVRSCSNSAVLPWTSVTQTEAAAACQAVPTSVSGTKMRLCTEAEWESACLAGNTGTAWSFSTAPSVYDDLVCNDAGAGINGPWETSHNNGQAQRCRTSGQLWDMSGNVAEWTGSCLTVLGKQYCRVRGGSFLSLGPATACNFSFVLDVPSFANFDLGFRCCSSVAP